MTSDPDEASRLLDVGLAVIGHVRASVGQLRRANTPKPLWLGAMGTMRLARLAEGMLTLIQARLSDLVEVFTRVGAESFAVALYLSKGGDSALDEVLGAHVHGMNLIENRIPELVPEWREFETSVDGQRLSYEQLITQKLPALLIDEPGVQAFMRLLYDGLYRGASMVGVHAGVGTFGLYQVSSDATQSLKAEGHSPDGGITAFGMTLLLLLLLARAVLDEAGSDSGWTTEMFDEVRPLLESVQNTALARAEGHLGSV